MSRSHGKRTVVKVDSRDISPHCNASEFNPTVDTHDTTGYGADAHDYDPGLTDGTFTASGSYDTSAVAGPGYVLKPLMGTPEKVEVIRQIEGAGSGKPQERFTVIVNSYTETAPVADYVQWSADMQICGDVDYTPQS